MNESQRPQEVHAEYLTPHQIGRNTYVQRTVGREDRLPDDDGGHLIARVFGGSKDIDNLVPQSKYINRPFKENGDWYNMEQDWQKAIKGGKTIKNIKIEVKYKGENQRPTQFQVEYEIDNKQFQRRIMNI